MKLKILDPELYAEPDYFGPAQPGDAGIDLRAAETVTVEPRTTVKIPLGVSIEIAPYRVGWLTGRSSTAIERNLITHEGKIDSGYRGEIHALLTAAGGRVTVARGERIAQLVVLDIVEADSWDVVEELSASHRGGSGLGSTGRV